MIPITPYYSVYSEALFLAEPEMQDAAKDGIKAVREIAAKMKRPESGAESGVEWS